MRSEAIDLMKATFLLSHSCFLRPLSWRLTDCSILYDATAQDFQSVLVYYRRCSIRNLEEGIIRWKKKT